MKMNALLAVLACMSSATFAAPPKVAVLDAVLPENMDQNVAIGVTEKISEELVGSGRYTVLDRTTVGQSLKEIEFQMSGLVSEADIKKAGEQLSSRLGASYVIVARVSFIGQTYFVSAKLIDVKTGEITAQSSDEEEGGIAVTLKIAQRVGRKLAGDVEEAGKTPAEKSKPTGPSPSPGRVNWIQMDTNADMQQSGMGMVYDSNRGVIVAFGGREGSGTLAETWEYSSFMWTLKNTPHAPPARFWFGMAYDSVRKRVVVFGGRNAAGSADLRDTWEFDGTDWTQVTTSQSPSARSNPVMAYDSYRRTTVLFGGANTTDTWEYDGANWARIFTAISPVGKGLSAMVFDEARRKIVKFGGDSSTNNTDTWEYDASGWIKIITATHPSYRWGHAMAYNSKRQRLVLFGGYNPSANKANDETWEYDGADWIRMAPSASPPAMEQVAMVYDPVQDCIILAGYGQTWQYRAFP